MKPVRLSPTDSVIPDILKLIQDSFAYMEDRIDPPSSMHRLTVEDIAAQCETGEVWCIGQPPVACVLTKVKNDALYVGKLAVATSYRGKGLASTLIRLAERRAKEKKLSSLELESRIELVENHRLFEKMGFTKTAEGRHEGYDRSTFIVMRKAIS